MKKRILPIFLYIITIAWMVIIFLFSGQNGTKSSNLSNSILINIRKIIFINFDNYSLEKQQNINSILSAIIRKGAHFSVYAILGLLMFLSTTTITKRKYAYIISAAFCFLYAISDEFHQGFVSGRNMSFIDVLIDFSGTLFILLIIYLFLLIKEKRRT